MIKRKSLQIQTILIASLFTFSFSFKAFNNTGNEVNDSRETRWSNHVTSLYNALGGEKEGLKFEVFQKALTGYYNLKSQNKLSKNLLSIVDFSLPSNQKRLWIVNLSTRKVLYHSLVSHGKNSGTTLAKSFSNIPETFMSSLGFYVTGSTYYGKHALSLRLMGMDETFNNNAFDRSIVIHGAKYVSESWIKKNGMLGRSHGCPAIPEEICQEVINLLADGACLFLYYPDQQYERKSSLLKTASILDKFNEGEPNSLETYHLN